MLLRSCSKLLLLLYCATFLAAPARSAGYELFARTNLVTWCIVPFDSTKRGPEQRAAMLERMGIRHFAYDYRAEHIPTFDAEIEALLRHHIDLTAWWFPTVLNDEARLILKTLQKHGIKTQLWVMGGGADTKSPDEHKVRVAAEVARLRPIAEEAAKIGCTVGLYNHGGWFGQPENQLAIIDQLSMPNVGIIYNLHHGHEHLARFAEVLQKIKPHLLLLNLNGMVKDGETNGKKILPLGEGDLDLALLKTIRDSGWHGPLGILSHVQVDAEARLLDNLAGLDWLVAQLDGQPAGPKPKLRTWNVPAEKSAAQKTTADWIEPMKKVHQRFTGKRGTLAQFGDSITVTLAYWAPLAYGPKEMPHEMAAALAKVKKYIAPECWDKWKGGKYGSEGGMTIRWALENIDGWLKANNPETAIIMFGSNDVGAMEVAEYARKTRDLVRRCLEHGTVVILTTSPPRHARVEKSAEFADAVRQIAREEHLPLIDFHAEILKRRAQDWDGALPQFKNSAGDEYQVLTLIARDGVHPSNPKDFSNKYSAEALRTSGYSLRNYLSLLAYADVIEKVLEPK